MPDLEHSLQDTTMQRSHGLHSRLSILLAFVKSAAWDRVVVPHRGNAFRSLCGTLVRQHSDAVSCHIRSALSATAELAGVRKANAREKGSTMCADSDIGFLQKLGLVWAALDGGGIFEVCEIGRQP